MPLKNMIFTFQRHQLVPQAGKPAGTLISMGISSKLAQTAVRLSLDEDNDMSQVEQF